MRDPESVIRKYTGSSAGELTDAGICPTCFNRQTGGAVFGDDSRCEIYKDNDVVIFLASNPRASGHTVISTTKHYQDLSETPDRLSKKIMKISCALMRIIKQVYACERVYICSMCDGPMNHCHVQLIPRYSFEKRGSSNFVKPRTAYVHDQSKVDSLKKMLEEELL